MVISHLLSAVKYLHKNGIVHRNLRPETIMFQSDGALSDIKLVDLISAINTKEIAEVASSGTHNEDSNLDNIIK